METKMTKLTVNNIEINIIKKNIKSIRLSVHPPDGWVRLAVPKGMKEEAVKLFVNSKLDWIEKQQIKLQGKINLSQAEYLSGESYYFQGIKYLLNVVHSSKSKGAAIRDNKYIDLFVKADSTREQRERVMMEWHRQHLKAQIPELISKWEPIMGVKVSEWGIKRMKTRWGTCNTAAKRIWINLELAKTHPRCLEYIIVHEMTHLLERNHNKRFKSYMDKFLPGWPSIKDELNNMIL